MRLIEPKLSKRELIIESAIEIFLEEGYVEASVDRIAQHSGVAKQTVYSTFKNKRSLFEAVIAVLAERSTLGERDEAWLQLPLIEFLEKASDLILHQMHNDRFPRFLRLITKECRMFPELQNLYGDTISKPWLNFASRYFESSTEISLTDPYATAFCLRACLATFATDSNFDPTGTYFRDRKAPFVAMLTRLVTSTGSNQSGRSVSNDGKTDEPHSSQPERSEYPGQSNYSEANTLKKSALRGADVQSTFGNDKRGVILDGALRAFLQSGFTMTSMDDVAVAADVSKQTVYGYFTDKKTLFESLSDEVLAHLRAELVAPASVAELKIFAKDFLDHLSKPPIREFIRVVMGESQKFHGSSDKYLLYLFRDYRQPIEQLLRVSSANPNADAAFLAMGLVGTLADYSILQLIYSTADYTELSSERLLQSLFELLGLS